VKRPIKLLAISEKTATDTLKRVMGAAVLPVMPQRKDVEGTRLLDDVTVVTEQKHRNGGEDLMELGHFATLADCTMPSLLVKWAPKLPTAAQISDRRRLVPHRHESTRHEITYIHFLLGNKLAYTTFYTLDIFPFSRSNNVG